MTQMRPGIKVRLWTPRFKNQPDIQPPGLLRLVSVLSIFSVIGVLFYAIAITTTGSLPEPDPVGATYVAVLHFVLPLMVTYTISGNYSSSRILITIYVAVLYGAILLGIGYLGRLETEPAVKEIVTTAAVAVIAAWLYRSPKMRFYYAIVSGKPVPSDLVGREEELAGRAWLSPKRRATLEKVADNLETLVLFGFIAVVVYALISTA